MAAEKKRTTIAERWAQTIPDIDSSLTNEEVSEQARRIRESFKRASAEKKTRRAAENHAASDQTPSQANNVTESHP
ncbi:hypothetical protein [Lignipirellula cremea]|uniref:hypothetical protein n=1 Tax=Lignipirellula cremea TaxID=2528010 RepID=UPI0011A8B8C9|nr:hypothetical protein [Lignipirellula cremea]